MNAISKDANVHTRSFSVCLYVRKKFLCSPQLVGNGIILKIKSEYFLLTAAHVVDKYIDQKIAIYFGTSVPGQPLEALDNLTVIRTEMPASGSRLDDPIDLAIFQLTDSEVNKVNKNLSFLTLSETSGKTDDNSLYLVHGFPCERSNTKYLRRSIYLSSLPYYTVKYNGDRGALNFAKSSIPGLKHYLIDLDFKGLSKDENDNKIYRPSPNGLSGCGIWRVWASGESSQNWSTKNIKLVAIEHRYDNEKEVVRGSKLPLALKMIVNSFPELKDEISSYYKFPGQQS